MQENLSTIKTKCSLLIEEHKGLYLAGFRENLADAFDALRQTAKGESELGKGWKDDLPHDVQLCFKDIEAKTKDTLQKVETAELLGRVQTVVEACRLRRALGNLPVVTAS